MADLSTFSGSVTDRFAEIKTPISDAMGMRVSPHQGAPDWQERDAAIGRAVKKGDATLAGWMAGLDTKLEAAKLFISNNNLPAAMAIDEEIRRVTNANSDSILRYSNLADAQPGSLAAKMRETATRLRDTAYLQDKVTFGGREYTYGSLLRSEEGRAAVEASTSDTLKGLGFSGDVAKFLVSGTSDAMADELKARGDLAPSLLAASDSTAKSCMKFLTDNDLKTVARYGGVMPPDRTTDGSRAVRNDMANELASNWRDYFMTFGTATEDFISRAYSSFRDSGGHRMMPGMRDYAVRVAQRTGLTGKALVEETFRQYDDWRAAVTKTQRRMAPGEQPDPDDVGLNEQNAALAGAISALARSDADFDLRSPEARANASELGDIVAKLKVSGVNLVALSRRNGVDVNRDMAEHLLGNRNPGSSIAGVRAFLEDMRRYTGGEDFATAVYGTTHSAADYWGSISRQVGGQSSCPGADAILLGLNRARMKSILPVMFERGLSHRDAVTVVRRDQALITGYASRVAQAFADALPGAGAKEAASALTRYVLDHESDAQGGGVNVQRLITDMAEGKVKGVKLSQAATDSLRGWVSGNVTDAALFGGMSQQMQQKLVGFGVEPHRAAMIASQASAVASRMKRDGKDWTRPFMAFLGDFTRVPQQQFDGNGKLVSTHMTFGHANKLDKEINLRGTKVKMTPGMYDANPAMFESFFREVEREGAELDRNRLLALKQLIKEDPAAYASEQTP